MVASQDVILSFLDGGIYQGFCPDSGPAVNSNDINISRKGVNDLQELKLRDDFPQFHSLSDYIHFLFYTDLGHAILRYAVAVIFVLYVPLLFLKFLQWHASRNGVE